jgi:hypothetical protein
MASFAGTDIPPIEIILDFILGGRHIVPIGPTFRLHHDQSTVETLVNIHDDAIDVCARRRDLVSVRSKFGNAGSGLSVTDLSFPHPPRRARSVEIRECRVGSVYNKPLPPPLGVK